MIHFLAVAIVSIVLVTFLAIIVTICGGILIACIKALQRAAKR